MLNLILLFLGLAVMATVFFEIHADATTINVAGAQRMLSRRVAKEALLAFNDAGEEAAVIICHCGAQAIRPAMPVI